MKVSEIIKQIEKVAPINLAESWDNPGLQVGDKNQDVKTVLTVLELTPEVLEEAKENNVDLILTHHPLIFNPLKNITESNVQGQMIRDLIKNNISLYSAHTNLDKADKGLNFFIGELLGLNNIKPLDKESLSKDYYKFVLYIPEDYLDQVLKIFEKYKVGHLTPKYSTCSFIQRGTGTFKALNGAKPYIGQKNELTKVKEIKIETVIKKSELKPLLKAIEKIHPYEEFAYDFYKDELDPYIYGLGIIGNYPQALNYEEFIKKVKTVFQIDHIKSAGPERKEIKKVALCTGAGSSLIKQAKRQNADVFITGDLTHHQAQLASELGLWVLDCSHFATEFLAKDLFYNLLKELKHITILKAKKDRNYLKLI